MPYEMNWEARGQYRRFHGRVTDQEIAESSRIMEGAPQFDEVRFVILDFLETEEIVLTNPEFIPEIAAVDSAAALSNPLIKIAVVATAPQVVGLAQAYAEDALCAYPLQVFATLADARAWASVQLPWTYRHLQRA